MHLHLLRWRAFFRNASSWCVSFPTPVTKSCCVIKLWSDSDRFMHSQLRIFCIPICWLYACYLYFCDQYCLHWYFPHQFARPRHWLLPLTPIDWVTFRSSSIPSCTRARMTTRCRVNRHTVINFRWLFPTGKLTSYCSFIFPTFPHCIFLMILLKNYAQKIRSSIDCQRSFYFIKCLICVIYILNSIKNNDFNG